MDVNFDISLEELFKNEKSISVDDFNTRVQKLHFEYIKHVLTESNPSLKHVYKFEDQAEYLIGLCTHPFISKYFSSQIYRDGLYVAAAVFEYLSDIAESFPNELDSKNYYLLKAALCYGLSGYESSSRVMSERIINNIGYLNYNAENIKNLSLDKLSHYCILKILKLSKGHIFSSIIYKTIQERVNDFLNSKLNIIDLEKDISDNYIHCEVILGCLDFGKGIDVGSEQLIQNSISKIESSRKLTAKMGLASYFFIIDSLLDIIKRYWNNSPWIRLSGVIKNNKYIENLNKDGIKVLWSSQIEALDLKSKEVILEAGYLDDTIRRIVVNMPTSAGKSLVAELLIAKILFDGKQNKCVYVVPTKALVAQVTRDLSSRFRIFGIRVIASYNDQEVANFESVFFDKTRVIVVTPEKLNYLIRQESDYLLSCKLFVFDEIHNISSEGRGWIYEETVSLLLQNQITSQAKMLFMSAIMPNSFSIREWVDPKELNEVIKTNWQPSRQLKAILKEEPKIRWDGAVRKRVGYQANLLFARNKEDIKTPHHIDNLFQTRELNETSWKNKTYVKLVNKFKAFGPVLIYFPKRIQSKDFCLEYIKLQNNSSDIINDDSLHGLIETFKEEKLPHDHILFELIKYGVAYHDGSLSNEIRLAIEDAFKKQIINILATSKTLIQGVNLPAKTFIISDYTMRYGNSKAYSLDKKDFKNLLGRVGRAAYDTEGQIVFCSIHENTDESWQNYLYIPENDEDLYIKSCLTDTDTIKIMENLCDAIDEAALSVEQILNIDNFKSKKQEKIELVKKVQSYALIQNTINDRLSENYIENVNNAIRDYTLVGRSEPITIMRFISYSSLAINNEISIEKQEIFKRTGLSTQSASILFAKAYEFWEKYSGDISFKIDKDFIKSISAFLFLLPEFKADDSYINILGELISQWIFEVNNKETGNEFFYNYFKTNIDTKKIKPNSPEAISEVFTRFHTDIIDYKAPWALSSFFIISEYILQKISFQYYEDIRENLSLLSSYCKYGVSNPPAALFCSLGLRPPFLSIKLSKVYDLHFGYNQFDYLKIINWLMGMHKSDSVEINYLDLINEYGFTEKEVKKIINLQYELDDFNSVELAPIIEEYIAKDAFVPSWKYFINVEMLAKIKVGEVCELVIDESNQVNPYAVLAILNGQKIGYVPQSINTKVSTLINEGLNVKATIAIANKDAIIPYRLALDIFLVKNN